MRNLLHRTTRTVSLLLPALLLLGACSAGGDEQTLQLPRNAQDLEAAARRGDSMTALIAVGQALADTVDRVLRGEIDPQLLATAAAARLAESSAVRLAESNAERAPGMSAGTGDALTQRALRRADSLARVSTAEMTRKFAPAAGRATGDSLRGVLEMENSASGARLVLNSVSSRMPVALGGMATSDLSRLAGFEVVVRGARMSPREFVVSAFVVRAVNGTPVDDGVLTNIGNGWSLQLAGGGDLRLTRAPSALQALVGERVWVALDERATPSFGLVLRRR
jgi:hypothetical protein